MLRNPPQPPIAIYGQWAVYSNAIVCALACYELSAYELEGAIDWERHLSDKRWCNLTEFTQARDHLLGSQRRGAA